MIDDDEALAIRNALAVAAECGLELVLIGAGARLVAFDRRYGLREPRTTKDWDFAAEVPDWAAYHDFHRRMTRGAAPGFAPTTDAHAFRHVATSVLIEVLPYGAIAGPEEAIIWPTTGARMSVTGLEEAAAAAEALQLGTETVRVTRPACLVALKLLAYAERRTTRDLEDVNHILSHATDVAIDEVFDTLGDRIAAGTLDYESAGAFHIGRQLAAMMGPDPSRRVAAVLDALLSEEEARDLVRLVPRTVLDESERVTTAIEERFRALRAGIAAHE